MVSNVTSTTSSTSAATTTKSSLGLDSDAFLKLFVTQLQYQDPLAPQDATAMMNQLAQISLVEQSYNTNTALGNLLTAQNSALSMSSVSFIGKNVKATGNSTSFDGSSSVQLQYKLPEATSGTTITITNSAGKVVRTVTLGSQSAGDLSYTWDGCNNSGTTLPTGAYTFAVKATSTSGSSVTATTYTTGRIDGVNYSGTTPYLTIGSITVPLSNIVSVTGA